MTKILKPLILCLKKGVMYRILKTYTFTAKVGTAMMGITLINIPMKCPNCSKDVYAVCDNAECSCHDGVPEEAILQVVHRFLNLEISERLFYILFAVPPVRPYLDDFELRCPYCGFSRDPFFWDDYSITSTNIEVETIADMLLKENSELYKRLAKGPDDETTSSQ